MGDPSVVVIDVGSYETKAGWANPEKDPPVVTPTAVRVRDAGGDEGRPSVSGETHRPVQRRVVRNWDEVEALWNYVLYDQLAWVAGEEGSVLVAEPLFNSRVSRATCGNRPDVIQWPERAHGTTFFSPSGSKEGGAISSCFPPPSFFPLRRRASKRRRSCLRRSM